MLSDNEGAIIATFVQAVLYGVYITTLVHCLRWLMYSDEGWIRRERINWPILAITMVVFVFSTTNLGISLKMTIVFVMAGDTLYTNILSATHSAMELTTMLITDTVLIYRCWAVYGRSWAVVCIPVALWFASTACSVVLIAIQGLAISNVNWQQAWMNWFSRLWVIFFSCNITINVYATVAIIYRILSVTQGSGNRSDHFRQICRILAESGILYTVSTALNLAASVLDTTPKYDVLKFILDAMNFSMAGIAFNLILTRVGQGKADQKRQAEISANSEFKPKSKPLSNLHFHVPTTTNQEVSSDFLDTIHPTTGGGVDEV